MADLFADAEEEDLTVVEDELNFDQATSLTQADDINDLTNMLDENLQWRSKCSRRSTFGG